MTEIVAGIVFYALPMILALSVFGTIEFGDHNDDRIRPPAQTYWADD